MINNLSEFDSEGNYQTPFGICENDSLDGSGQ